MILFIEKNVAGPRLHVCGYRIHHFHFGVAAIAAGAYLIAKDFADFTHWMKRFG